MELMKLEPAVIQYDLQEMTARLSEIVKPYEGMDADKVSQMPIKDVEVCAKDLKAKRKEIDNARKAIKREYNKPLDAFEADMKSLIGIIDQHLSLYTDALNIHEEMRKGEKQDQLRMAYEDFAPALVEVVPFDRIFNPRWLNKTFAYKKAEQEMLERVQKIASEWESLKAATLNYPQETERVFFDCLDLGEALRYDQLQKEKADRIEAMRKEVAPEEPKEESYPTQEETYPAQAVGLEPEDELTETYVMTFTATGWQLKSLIAAAKKFNIHGDVKRLRKAESLPFEEVGGYEAAC